jgi:molybdenum-dependent DNA-binding transcriptional regulator ModE
MCGCIVLPLGLGAAFFYVVGERAERAMAEAQALQREALRAQAEAQAAQNAREAAMSTPTTSPPANVPNSVPTGALSPDSPTATPPLTFPPLGGLAESGVSLNSPENVAAMLADVEQRKNLYRVAFKPLREAEQQLKRQGGGDPNATALIASLKQIVNAYGLTQEQIDKILAEGDKEGW